MVRGEKPRRWIQQTDFGNDEAVGYLADRLARLGVEEALAEAGAQAGAEVVIGDGARTPSCSDLGIRRSRRAPQHGFGPRGDRPRRLTAVTGKRARILLRPRRVVVKVGSSSLTTAGGAIDGERIAALAEVLAARVRAGGQVGAGLVGRDRGRAQRRSACPAARATWPPSRRRRASGRGC